MTYALDAWVAVLFDTPAHLPPASGLGPLNTKDQTLMVWFKVDDSFYDHPKAEELSDSAVALWTRAGSYCAKHLTDGFISHRKADRMCDDPATAITELLNAGLWEKSTDGYWFHDWHEYQPTREEALATSKAKSVGGAVGNHRRWHVERGKVDPECPYCTNPHRSTDRITDQSSESLPNRPTRPDPTQPKTEHPADVLFGGDAPNEPAKPKKQAAKPTTRIPDDFAVTEAMVAWAVETTPLVDGKWQTAKFVDYWQQATRNARKKDWVAAWRTWMRNAQERAEERSGPGNALAVQQDRRNGSVGGYPDRSGVAVRDVKPQAEPAEVRKSRGWLALPTGGAQ